MGFRVWDLGFRAQVRIFDLGSSVLKSRILGPSRL